MNQKAAPIAANTTRPLASPLETALQELYLQLFALTSPSSAIEVTPNSPGLKALDDESNVVQNGRRMSISPRVLKAKALLADVSPEELHEAVYRTYASNTPDFWNTHFLDGNEMDVSGALEEIFRHLHWRIKLARVDSHLLAHGEVGMARIEKDPKSSKKAVVEAKGCLRVLRRRDAYILPKRDRQGRIITLIKVKDYVRGEFPSICDSTMAIYQVEISRLLCRNVYCSGILMFDMTGYTMQNMDYRPLKHIIKIMKTYYPTFLTDVVVHNMPTIFTPVWELLKRLLRPEFIEHVHFTRTVADLEKFISIDRIPKDLGGQSPFEFVYQEPDLQDPSNGGGDEAERQVRAEQRAELEAERMAVAREFEAVTTRWAEGARAGRDVSKLRTLRNELSEKLVWMFWRLDPYTRARGIYDRLGWVANPPQLDPEDPDVSAEDLVQVTQGLPMPSTGLDFRLGRRPSSPTIGKIIAAQ